MKQKSKLSKFNKFLSVVFVICLIATVCMVSLKPAATAPTDGDSAGEEDAAVIDEFASGTYGGVEFAKQEDVVAYYAQAFDKTKAQTAEYVLEDGSTVTWYAMLGEEDLQVSNIMIEGKENATINKLVPGIVGGLFTKGACGLSPSSNRVPADDVDETGQSLQACLLTPDDVLVANVTDNNDGTITLKLQPKAVNMSHRGADAQGHMFNTLGAIDETVDKISALSWQSGTTAENCLVNYKGGVATVTIDTTQGVITTADYHMEAHITVQHANVTVLKDKSANLLVTYDVHYPASADYLSENIKAKAK